MLTAEISLKRKMSLYLLCIYCLCTLVVCMNYLIFWLNVAFMPFRLMLTMVNLVLLIYLYIFYSVFNSSHPNIKAIDVYIIICIIFVLVSLLENIFVQFFEQRNEIQPKDEEENGQQKKKWPKIDNYFIKLYPISFIFTMLLYTVTYYVL